MKNNEESNLEDSKHLATHNIYDKDDEEMSPSHLLALIVSYRYEIVHAHTIFVSIPLVSLHNQVPLLLLILVVFHHSTVPLQVPLVY